MSVELIRDEGGVVVGVLILRCEDERYFDLAREALRIDARWGEGSIEEGLRKAVVIRGRWFKTPDRHNPGAFLFTLAPSDGAKAGASPGALIRLFGVPYES